MPRLDVRVPAVRLLELPDIVGAAVVNGKPVFDGQIQDLVGAAGEPSELMNLGAGKVHASLPEKAGISAAGIEIQGFDAVMKVLPGDVHQLVPPLRGNLVKSFQERLGKDFITVCPVNPVSGDFGKSVGGNPLLFNVPRMVVVIHFRPVTTGDSHRFIRTMVIHDDNPAERLKAAQDIFNPARLVVSKQQKGYLVLHEDSEGTR